MSEDHKALIWVVLLVCLTIASVVGSVSAYFGYKAKMAIEAGLVEATLPGCNGVYWSSPAD